MFVYRIRFWVSSHRYCYTIAFQHSFSVKLLNDSKRNFFNVQSALNFQFNLKFTAEDISQQFSFTSREICREINKLISLKRIPNFHHNFYDVKEFISILKLLYYFIIVKMRKSSCGIQVVSYIFNL